MAADQPTKPGFVLRVRGERSVKVAAEALKCGIQGVPVAMMWRPNYLDIGFLSQDARNHFTCALILLGADDLGWGEGEILGDGFLVV